MFALRVLPALVMMLLASPALAEDGDGSDEPQDDSGDSGGWVTVGGGGPSGADAELDEMSAWAALERLPPRTSTEIAVQMSFGDISYWRDHRSYSGPFPGWGIRHGWGRNFPGGHRVGLQTVFSVEGPVPLYYTMMLAPLPSWDWVTKGIQIGASAGVAPVLHQHLDEGVFLGAVPALAIRMGYSQGWTRVGRRVFVVLEPSARMMKGQPNLTGTLVIGQGRGK